MSAPKKFLNETTNAVNEFIDGLLLSNPNTLKRLDGHDVVLANPLPCKDVRVRILSGGGSGHEPSHAGWIGKGMLTGAILGGIFASPSVKSILAAIRAVTPVIDESNSNDQGRGCLLVVKNYTGDRLNFGMACELANAEGRRTRMVVVADDCAIPRSKGETGARGVAGTVFVHKIAGAAALQGKSLDEIVDLANYASSRIGSLGVALDAVTLPGASALNTRLEGNMIEIGLGIHGEAGIRQSPMMSADELAKEMLDTIHEFGFKGEKEELCKLKSGDELAILVNNLGGASNFELSILSRSLMVYLENEMKCTVKRAYVGSFMTSFNMHGASVSVLCLDGDGKLGSLLDADANAPAWTKADVLVSSETTRPSMVPFPEVQAPQSTSSPDTLETVAISNFESRVSSAISAACSSLIENEQQLTEWDTIVGDGDCGITMARGAKEVKKRLEDGTLPLASPSKLFLSLADAVSASMGGTSGILFELMFRRCASSLSDFQKGGKAVDENAMSEAFVDGVKAVSFYGGAKVGYRTMMDALVPAADAVGDGLEAVTKAAADGADSTAVMKTANAGRSNYLSEEQLEGTPDPGAKAVAMIMSGISSI